MRQAPKVAKRLTISEGIHRTDRKRSELFGQVQPQTIPFPLLYETGT